MYSSDHQRLNSIQLSCLKKCQSFICLLSKFHLSVPRPLSFLVSSEYLVHYVQVCKSRRVHVQFVSVCIRVHVLCIADEYGRAGARRLVPPPGLLLDPRRGRARAGERAGGHGPESAEGCSPPAPSHRHLHGRSAKAVRIAPNTVLAFGTLTSTCSFAGPFSSCLLYTFENMACLEGHTCMYSSL